MNGFFNLQEFLYFCIFLIKFVEHLVMHTHLCVQRGNQVRILNNARCCMSVNRMHSMPL